MIRHLYNKKNVKDHNGNNKTVVGNNVVVEDLLDASVSPLLADLVGPDPAMRERAREALVALGDAVVPALIQLLATPQATCPLGGGQGPRWNRRADLRHGPRKCPGRYRRRRPLGGGRGIDRLGPRGSAALAGKAVGACAITLAL